MKTPKKNFQQTNYFCFKYKTTNFDFTVQTESHKTAEYFWSFSKPRLKPRHQQLCRFWFFSLNCNQIKSKRHHLCFSSKSADLRIEIALLDQILQSLPIAAVIKFSRLPTTRGLLYVWIFLLDCWICDVFFCHCSLVASIWAHVF